MIEQEIKFVTDQGEIPLNKMSLEELRAAIRGLILDRDEWRKRAIKLGYDVNQDFPG